MVDEPLLELLRQLRAREYNFITVTPATHARVLARDPHVPPTLRHIFGWNRPFDPNELEPEFLSLLHAADALEVIGTKVRSKVRVAQLDGDLLLHSSFPTDQSDSVFFGPDTYRFARFLKQHLGHLSSPSSIVDMGAGTGAGAIVAARLSKPTRVTLVDTNPAALRLARVNAAFAGLKFETLLGSRMPDGADLVIANPPYMIDEEKRAYRDGGPLLGGAVALEWLQQALATMAPGGVMLLYTGAAFQRGQSPCIEALRRACSHASAEVETEELDPDVFGEELEKPAYNGVERIAAVGSVIRKASAHS